MEFHSASTLDEALDLLDAAGDETVVLAGGTDVVLQYRRGEIAPTRLLHIERIPGLADVTANGAIRIGALVTHRTAASAPTIRSRLPALAEAAGAVGGWQTQEVGTIVGNVCNASPAADTVPALLVADTRVELTARHGHRRLPLAEFVLGRRRTARAPEELVTALEMEPLPPRSAETYLKVGPRSRMEVAVVGLALRLSFAEDATTVAAARIAACSVAPAPFRAGDAEAALVGSRLEPEAVAEAGRLLAAAARPIDDQRATAAYRRRVLGPLLARAVDVCRTRVRGG